MDLETQISINPEIRNGKPCITGTRIAVFDVLDWLAQGQTTDEIISDFPQLTKSQIQACIAFAAERERRLAG